MNSFVQLVAIIWILSTIVSLRTKSTNVFEYASLTTVLVGIGYFVYMFRFYLGN